MNALLSIAVLILILACAFFIICMAVVIVRSFWRGEL